MSLSLFARKQPEPEQPAGGGMAVLRGRAKAHARTPAAHALLRDALQASGDELDAFLNGGPLAGSKITLLLNYLSINATYDSETDLLRSTMPEPAPMGCIPERYAPPATVDAPRSGPAFSAETPHTHGMLKPVDLRKPGWAS